MSGGIGDIDAGNETSTEDDILNEVQDISGDNFDGDDDDDSSETQGRKPPADDDDEAETSDRKTTEEDAESGQQPARERIDSRAAAERIPKQRRVDYDYDQRTGDVINPKTGELIFKNGTVEREMFRQLQDGRFQQHRIENEFRNVVAQGQMLEKTLAVYKNVPSVGDTLKLSTEDQVQAFQHMAAFKANPVQALRKMLNDFQVDGGDLTDIFDNLDKIQSEGLEAKIAKLIEPIVKPKQEEDARATQHQELVQRLNNEMDTFFNDNPEAEQHADLLAHVINRSAASGRQMSLNAAWTHVLKFANARRLDVTQPFSAQIQRDEPVAEPTRRPMPSGRVGGNRVTPKMNGKPSYEMRNKDIVAEAMRDAGFDT